VHENFTPSARTRAHRDVIIVTSQVHRSDEGARTVLAYRDVVIVTSHVHLSDEGGWDDVAWCAPAARPAR
jgi:hypothetical protein